MGAEDKVRISILPMHKDSFTLLQAIAYKLDAPRKMLEDVLIIDVIDLNNLMFIIIKHSFIEWLA